MTNSNLRDQRGRIYDYNESGGDGYASSSYSYVAERWCRVGSPSGREATIAAQSQHTVDAVITFASNAPVTPNGLIKVGGKFYRVTSVPPPNRLLDELAVQATYVDDASFTVTGEP